MKGTTGNAVLDEILSSLLDEIMDTSEFKHGMITCLDGEIVDVEVVTNLIKFKKLNGVQENVLRIKLRDNGLFRELAWAWDKENRTLAITQVEFAEH